MTIPDLSPRKSSRPVKKKVTRKPIPKLKQNMKTRKLSDRLLKIRERNGKTTEVETVRIANTDIPIAEEDELAELLSNEDDPFSGFNKDNLQDTGNGFMDKISFDTMTEKPSLSDEMYNSAKDIRVKTRVNRKMALASANAIVYTRWMNGKYVDMEDMMKDYQQVLFELLISRDGEGRKEAIEMQKANAGIVPFATMNGDS